MAISVDWPSKVISVPQADLTLVSGTIYTLDTNTFRLALKALEDDSVGMPWPRTHRHNTEVTVAGVTYARVIEIINGYTVSFEDGQYTVILQGSNNNIFDVQGGILAQNQVQVVPTNSAGLIVRESGVSGLTAAESADLARIRKLLDNRQELVDTGSVVVMRTYDDDGTSIFSENVVTKSDDSKPNLTDGIVKRGVPS